jgi:large subunit ribosomal protein L23Ae
MGKATGIFILQKSERMAKATSTPKTAAGKTAAKVSKKTLKGAHGKAVKVRTKVHFYKPKTLKLARAPRYSRKSLPSRNKLDKYRIIKAPLTTESAMKKIEDNNTLVFLVDLISNKRQIKDAVQQLYDIKVQKVNTLIRYTTSCRAFSSPVGGWRSPMPISRSPDREVRYRWDLPRPLPSCSQSRYWLTRHASAPVSESGGGCILLMETTCGERGY